MARGLLTGPLVPALSIHQYSMAFSWAETAKPLASLLQMNWSEVDLILSTKGSKAVAVATPFIPQMMLKLPVLI